MGHETGDGKRPAGRAGPMSEPELLVEGEPWTGLVVVALWPPGPSNIGLVRADNWCRLDKTLILWRGPEKPDEEVKRSRLTEITCRSVLVDENGFYKCVPDEGGSERLYPCEEIDEELESAVKSAAEKYLNERANEYAAETQSYMDSEDAAERYGSEVYAIATFGDAVAVNGESRMSAKHPARWKETDMGGRIPTGHETQFEKGDLVEYLVSQLDEELKVAVHPTTVRRILNAHYGDKDYIFWSSDSGESEVWVSPKALRAYEKEQEEEEKRKQAEELERRRKARIEEEERRRKEQAERRERVKRGGFPFPTDWSPRGSEVP